MFKSHKFWACATVFCMVATVLTGMSIHPRKKR